MYGRYQCFCEYCENLIHPDYVDAVREKKFYWGIVKKIDENDYYLTLYHPEITFKAMPEVFTVIDSIKFEFGDKVKVMVNERNKTYHEGIIIDISWHSKYNKQFYFIKENNKVLKKRYFYEDLEKIGSI